MIKGKPAFGEKINEREVDFLTKNAVPGFFEMSYDGKKQLTYEAPCSMSLAKYLKDQKLDQKSFWKIMAQMLDVEIMAKNRGLYPAHLIMKPEAVFLDENTLQMYFMYQPVTGSKDLADDLFAIIHDLIYQEMKKNGGTGEDYLIDFQNYLHQGDYRLEHVRQYIAQASSGGRLSGIGSRASQQIDQAGEDDLEQYTVMLGSGGSANHQNVPERKKSIQLTRVRTKERTLFSTDVIHMGRSSQNSYCIAGNGSIGRVHAAIVRREDVCYLKDLGSVNGTFINGMRLKENQACRIKSGDRIQLADEEFVFELNQ